MTIVSLAVLVSMNVQLAQSLKVISILSTQMLVQNVALVLMHVRLKQLAWANNNQEKYDNGCPSNEGRPFFVNVKAFYKKCEGDFYFRLRMIWVDKRVQSSFFICR